MLNWPAPDDPQITFDVSLDEVSIEHEPVESPEQAAIAALVHSTAGGIALTCRNEFNSKDLYDEAGSTNSIAFSNAERAKQYLHYANRFLKTDEQKRFLNDLVRDANSIISDVLRHQHDYDEPEDDELPTFETVNADATIRIRTIEKFRRTTAAYMDQLNLPEEIQDEWETAIVRMIAYLGAPEYASLPYVTHNPDCHEIIETLYRTANAVVKPKQDRLKVHIDDSMEKYSVLLRTLIENPIGVNDTHLGIYSPDANEHGMPVGTDVFIIHLFHGIKYIQSAKEPYPHGFPAALAREHIVSIKERIENLSEGDANLHALWQIVHNLEGAISVGIHDLDHSTVEVIVDNFRQGDELPNGIIKHIAKSLSLDNAHATQFLSKWYLAPKNSAPTLQQGKQIMDTALSAGLDTYQLTDLAKHLNQDPASIGITIPPIPKETLEEIDDVETLYVPDTNARYFRQRMKHPNNPDYL